LKIRIKFTKEECVKFLGHLDIMRAFQKCMNRAQIRMSYSEGFNPHQKMSFALPLGVGITSRAEYMDCEIADGQNLEIIKNNLNDVCGPGFVVLSVKQLKDDALKAMSAVKYADFNVTLPNNDITKQNVCAFLNQNTIITLKKSKSGEKEEDIRPMIISADINDSVLTLRLTAGSINNLKAETFVKALYEYLNIPYDKYAFSIERVELLGDKFISLDNMGTI